MRRATTAALLPELIDKNNTASDVWADTAYRSQANEQFLAGRLLRSQIHRKKPKGKPMPRRTAHDIACAIRWRGFSRLVDRWSTIPRVYAASISLSASSSRSLTPIAGSTSSGSAGSFGST